jgi:hypothetical protein
MGLKKFQILNFKLKIANSKIQNSFTPLESPSIYAGDGRNESISSLMRAGQSPSLSNGVYSRSSMMLK